MEDVTQLAMSVAEFCRRHNISRSLFYVLRANKTAPQTMKVGKRTLISDEAAAAWRRRMELIEK